MLSSTTVRYQAVLVVESIQANKRSHDQKPFSREFLQIEDILQSSSPKTRSPTTMKVIAVLLLLASLSFTDAFVLKQPASSRATTDLSAMKKKMGEGSKKVRILTTHELTKCLYQWR
jgi:hypothetical protein